MHALREIQGGGVTSHSQEWLDNGKSQLAEDATVYGAKDMVLSVEKSPETPGLLEKSKRISNKQRKTFGIVVVNGGNTCMNLLTRFVSLVIAITEHWFIKKFKAQTILLLGVSL